MVVCLTLFSLGVVCFETFVGLNLEILIELSVNKFGCDCVSFIFSGCGRNVIKVSS